MSYGGSSTSVTVPPKSQASAPAAPQPAARARLPVSHPRTIARGGEEQPRRPLRWSLVQRERGVLAQREAFHQRFPHHRRRPPRLRPDGCGPTSHVSPRAVGTRTLNGPSTSAGDSVTSCRHAQTSPRPAWASRAANSACSGVARPRSSVVMSPSRSSAKSAADRARARGRPRNDRAHPGRAEPFEPVVAADEPVDLIGVEGDHEIFEDAGPLVIPKFRTEIDPPARPGDLDDQLRAPGEIPLFAYGSGPRARVG